MPFIIPGQDMKWNVNCKHRCYLGIVRKAWFYNAVYIKNTQAINTIYHLKSLSMNWIIQGWFSWKFEAQTRLKNWITELHFKKLVESFKIFPFSFPSPRGCERRNGDVDAKRKSILCNAQSGRSNSLALYRICKSWGESHEIHWPAWVSDSVSWINLWFLKINELFEHAEK